ncbi:PA domain-containing protein [Aphelenchoides besseyi]|nr:PA domain-containing protein [Aphelenchoides besseyi]
MIPPNVFLHAIWLALLLIVTRTMSYDSLFFTIESPESLKYMYEINPSYSIGSRFPEKVHTVAFFYADPPEACSPLKNSLQIRGEAVLIERGECSFVEKAVNGYIAGAAFIIVTDSNNASDTIINMVSDDTGRYVNVPIAYLPGVSGRKLRQFFLYEGDSMTINIPMNMTFKAMREALNRPPWELW